MADGYARASGRPAACFIITGPGLTNIATALGQAYANSIPMLVISSVNRRDELGLGEGRLHELPSQRNLLAGLTAFSHTLMRADELPQVLARAFTLFPSARPRPVHIEIPLDVITAPADNLRAQILTGPGRPSPNPARIAEAAALLRGAKQPLVVLGGGAQDAAGEARSLIERLGAPTVMTVNAKGILPEGHPLSLGSSLPQPPISEALAEADVVLAVGTEFGETDTMLFESPASTWRQADPDRHRPRAARPQRLRGRGDRQRCRSCVARAVGGIGAGSSLSVSRQTSERHSGSVSRSFTRSGKDSIGAYSRLCNRHCRT